MSPRKAFVLMTLAVVVGGVGVARLIGAPSPLPSSVESPTPSPEPLGVSVPRVRDGDTLCLTIACPDDQAVRLIGINTPERGRCYAGEATQRTTDLVVGQPVRLEAGSEDRDRYGRLLRFVFVDDLNVNLALVQEGAAEAMFCDRSRCWTTNAGIAPPEFVGRVPYAGEILLAEQEAKAAKRGLWGACL